MSLPRGLYDQVVTSALASSLTALQQDEARLRPLSQEEVIERLKDAFGSELRHALEAQSNGKTGVEAQLSLINGLLAHLREAYADTPTEFVAPPQILESIFPRSTASPVSPETGLSIPWLFTAGKGTPALLEELRREAESCDRIDILVSFITMSGVRKILDILEAITSVNAEATARTEIRVLTTTYTGATEVGAVDRLARLNGTKLKISLDGRRTRLHAKAWIFHRRTGFGSAYVGSANLSGSALLGGLEWTVKFTERGHEALFRRAEAHFDTLWEDSEFSPYHPDSQGDRAALIQAIRIEGGDRSAESGGGSHSFFDIQPKQYQQEMLAALANERELGRNRNLVVAATGTGKTVVAALDYRRQCEQLGHKPRLLFIAHRHQILRQAIRTFREVLKDHSFGDLLVGGETPRSNDYLFASIDTLAARDVVATLGADYWHTVVFDECHRIAANRFDTIAKQLKPKYLLGLTATPERTDGKSILAYFDNRSDGSPAVELRLWDALDLELLSPFEYYGCDDDTDFSEVPWESAGEVAAINKLVTGNAARARLVLNEWHRLSASPAKGKAIAFCVSVEHARFTSESFNSAGIPSKCVTGETSLIERARAIRELSEGRLACLVTVDLFNEGVDLPAVDTLLLLRPTQSALLFQQQIGRGLRLSPGKDSCLILDFVGQHRAEFRFDRLLGSITGLTRAQLVDAVENGFSTLSPACHIRLQNQTRTQVLKSLRAITAHGWRNLASELRSYATNVGAREVSLSGFMSQQHIQLPEIYRDARPTGWTQLRRTAELVSENMEGREVEISKNFRSILHCDDRSYLRVIDEIACKMTSYYPKDPADATRAQMLAYQLDTARKAIAYHDIVRELAKYPRICEELHELVGILAEQASATDRPIPGIEDLPLRLHCAYRINEIRTAFGDLTAQSYTPFQAGVLTVGARRLQALLVTLDKSEGFHDRIAYHDYAISPSRFHWQSQNTAGPDTPAGKRYTESHSNGWSFQLFARATKGTPYRACGPVRIDSTGDVSGNRPMSIIWTLAVPLPPGLFRELSILRS